MNEPTSRTLSLAEAAAILDIGRSTAYALAARDAFPIPVLKIGSLRKVSRNQLEAFLEQARVAS